MQLPEPQTIASTAEEERFELPVPFSTTVFKTAPLNHSGIPPNNAANIAAFQKNLNPTAAFSKSAEFHRWFPTG